MLKVLRHKKTARKVWIFLALIIIPAFALWGFGGAFRTKEESRPFGKISNRYISKMEFRDSLSAVTTTAILQYGDKLPEIKKYLNLEGQAWQRLILLEEAKRRSIKASDQEVITLIEKMPFFQYKGGFDNKLYNQALQYVFFLQPRAFEEQVRQSIILNKLYQQITDGLISVDENEIRKEFSKTNQEINISYISSLTADFAERIKPNESELKDYFAKNKGMFKENKKAPLPEFNSVKQKVKEAFVNAEALKLAEQKINQCAKELKSRKFNEAARKCGLKVKDTGPFKFGANIKGLGATDIFWETAKRLNEGQFSEIIRLPPGFYIIKVKGTSKFDEKKYGQEKMAIEKNLLDRKKQEKFNEFLVELNKKSAAY